MKEDNSLEGIRDYWEVNTMKLAHDYHRGYDDCPMGCLVCVYYTGVMHDLFNRIKKRRISRLIFEKDRHK